MPNTLFGKSLHLCFSIIKRSQPQLSPPPHHPPQPTTTTTTTTTAATTFITNYNSLYEDYFHSATASPPVSDDDDHDEDVGPTPTTPDLTSVYTSGRFFISYPGRSNSIVDSLAAEEEVAGGVPVQTYSPDPYGDFRRSMEEMVEARELETTGKEEAGKYLQELLMSYLSLNPKGTHKYIVCAFTDLVLSLLSSSPSPSSSNIIINSSSPSSSSTTPTSSRS